MSNSINSISGNSGKLSTWIVTVSLCVQPLFSTVPINVTTSKGETSKGEPTFARGTPSMSVQTTASDGGLVVNEMVALSPLHIKMVSMSISMSFKINETSTVSLISQPLVAVRI